MKSRMPSSACKKKVAAAGGQWIRIVIAIGLAVRVRRPSRWTRVDGELGPIIGDVVVGGGSSRAQRSTDVVWTTGHCFTRGTAVGCGDGICCQEPRAAARG